MIITRLHIKNLFCFDDSEIDLTYRRQPAINSIEYESLEDRPSVHFKRVCILSGGNATGKTSFAKLLCAAQNFIYRKDTISYLREAIAYPEKEAVLQIEFIYRIDEKPYLHELTIHLSKTDEFNELQVDSLRYISVYIRQNDSMSTARKHLKTVIKNKGTKRYTNYISFKYRSSNESDIRARSDFEKLKFHDANWMYDISHYKDKTPLNPMNEPYLSAKVLEKILTTFDSSIIQVEDIHNNSGKFVGYSVHFKNGNDLQLDDEFETSADIDRLSTGTIMAISIAKFYSRILLSRRFNSNGTFFLDEKMAYVHSEIEQVMLNAMIEALPKQGQLFYTTHNYDVLDMNLPAHSFTFLRKIGENSEFIDPTDKFKKNDRSLLNYVKDDVFKTLPDTSKIDDLLNDFEETLGDIN